MKTAIVSVLVIVALSATTGAETFTGTISDDQCAMADHSKMRMGSNDAECANACVSAHGAAYVLYDGKTTYSLSGGRTLEKFAGQKVSVVGTLDPKAKTIKVDSIAPAK